MRLTSLLLLLFSFSVLAKDSGDSLAEARDTGQASVRVLYVESAGWAYRDQHDRLTGVTVEIMRRFADYVRQHHGIELELEFVEEVDWTRFYQRSRDASGGVFGLGNVTITAARAEELAFSPPYVTNVAVFISHEDLAEVDAPGRAAEQLAGLRGLAFAGTLHETRLLKLRDRHWPALKIDRATSNDEIIETVAKGGHFGWIDAYNYHRASSQGHPLKRHPALDDPGEEFGIIMPLDNDWQDVLTGFFAHDGGLLQHPAYRKLLADHLGETVAELLAGQ